MNKQQIITQKLLVFLFLCCIIALSNLVKQTVMLSAKAQQLSCEEKGFVSCNKLQADNGYTINSDGYLKGNVCYRKIYQYEQTQEEGGFCCSTPFTQAADQAECKQNIVGTVPEPSVKPTGDICIDEGLQYCENGKIIKKVNGRKNESEVCVYDFQDLGLSDECKDKETGTVVTTPSPQLSCQVNKVAVSYLDSKVLTNLAYFKAIVKGIPDMCVKADLGEEPHLYAHSQTDSENQRRLFMCSGKNGEIKWRVVSDDGTSLVQTQEEFSKDINDLPNQEQVKQAERLVK